MRSRRTRRGGSRPSSATWPASRSTVPNCSERLASQYRLDDFESVDYRIVRNDAGERGLEIDLRRKSWGPTFLRLGVGVENDYEGGATANAAAQLRMTRLNALDAEWIIDGQIGEEPKLQTEFYQPLSLRRPYFIAPAFRYEQVTLQIVSDEGQRVARYRTRDTEVSLAVGAELSNWGEVRVGMRRGDGSSHVLVGDPALPTAEFDLGGAFVNFGYDRLDSGYFPKQGQAFRASWLADRESLGATRDADIVRASWQLARSRGRYSLVWSMDGGSALDDQVVSPQELFTLGGLFDISGLAVRRQGGHPVRHRARHPVPPHQPRRHGLLRVPGLHRLLGGSRQRVGDPR